MGHLRMVHVASEGERPLCIRTKRLKVVDYYTVPWDDVPAATPSPVMIVVSDLASGGQEPFAWHLAAERKGIPPDQIFAQKAGLERQILDQFFQFVTANRKSRWLHW